MVSIAKSNGPHFTDPREFYRHVSAAADTYILSVAGTASASTAVAYFTEADIRGLSDDTSWSADTYKTVLSISSGIGLVSNLLGPTGLAGTPTTTWRITVDGIATVIALTATGTGQRAGLGAISSNGVGAEFTTAKTMMNGIDSIDAGKTTQFMTAGSDTATTWPWHSLRFFGTPCLIYRRSLLIEAKSSEANSTTTNRERRSAVQYMSFS